MFQATCETYHWKMTIWINLMTTTWLGVPNRTAFSTQEGLRTWKSGITCRRWQFYSYRSKVPICKTNESPNTLPWEDTKNWIRHTLLSRQVSFWFVHVPLVSWRVKSNGSVKGSILGHLIQISELENMKKKDYIIIMWWRFDGYSLLLSVSQKWCTLSLSPFRSLAKKVQVREWRTGDLMIFDVSDLCNKQCNDYF